MPAPQAIAGAVVGSLIAGAVVDAGSRAKDAIFGSKSDREKAEAEDEKNAKKVDAYRKLSAKKKEAAARKAESERKRADRKGASASAADVKKRRAAALRAQTDAGRAADKRAADADKAAEKQLRKAEDEDEKAKREQTAAAKERKREGIAANKKIDAKLSADEKEWEAQDKAAGVQRPRKAGEQVTVNVGGGGAAFDPGMRAGGTGKGRGEPRRKRDADDGLDIGKLSRKESPLDALARNSPLAVEARQAARDAAERERKKVEDERQAIRDLAERERRKNLGLTADDRLRIYGEWWRPYATSEKDAARKGLVPPWSDEPFKLGSEPAFDIEYRGQDETTQEVYSRPSEWDDYLRSYQPR